MSALFCLFRVFNFMFALLAIPPSYETKCVFFRLRHFIFAHLDGIFDLHNLSEMIVYDLLYLSKSLSCFFLHCSSAHVKNDSK